ncbi:MAG: toxin-antitoxin system YwqK family antitoxin [Bacteroidota bacterium]
MLNSCSNYFDGKNGIKTVYFPNTDKIQQVVEFKNGKRDGPLKEYYKNGNLKIQQYYKNDSLIDSAIFYYENGQPAEIQFLKDHKKEGIWKKFNKNGKVYSEMSYKDDLLDGISSTYTYRSGRLLKRLNYKYGRMKGRQEFYHNNGRPKSVNHFYNGEPGLGTEEWYESGEKVNNDFNILVQEQNKVLLENTLRYFITLENSQPDDEVFVLSDNDTGNVITTLMPLQKKNGNFIWEYTIARGGFIMERLKLGAFRKNKMNNVVIKTITINVSANNY